MKQTSPADRAMDVAAESVKIQANTLASLQEIKAKLDVLIDRAETADVLIAQTPSVSAREFLENLISLHSKFIQSENKALRKLAEEMGDWIRRIQKDSLGAYDAIGLILSKTQASNDLSTDIAELRSAIAALIVQLQFLRIGEQRV